jgi:Ni/Fe-hydrogenase subunit HybB-like protein
MQATASPLPTAAGQVEAPEDPREQLMHDLRPRGEMNSWILESMRTVTWKFWSGAGILLVLVLSCLVYAWYVLIDQGLGVAGVNRPIYWGIFLSNTVYWIGLSHAGAVISALLRVLKVEVRRPFTRAAELMTAFGLVQVGANVFMHLGRVWLSYWLFPYPNQRGIWPDFHSPLMWDFMAIITYIVCSAMYLYMPMIPDLAMVRDRTTGWFRNFYRVLSVGFRGTEGEWKNLHSAMNIFAFAIIPLMVSVTSIVSWDFAMATRPGWSSTIFGPYFVVGALHSGIAAVAIVLFVARLTMKNMKYFLRPEHFDFLGRLMLIMSMAWAYFFFNDYLVPWYGGDQWQKLLQEFIEKGPLWWMWYSMFLGNLIIPWLILWRKKWRKTPWLMAAVGIGINLGMWFERYMIVGGGLTINRMPFTWQVYMPKVEIILTIGTLSLFLFLFLLASRIVPLVPVWEIQEGQLAHTLRKIGRAEVSAVSDID